MTQQVQQAYESWIAANVRAIPGLSKKRDLDAEISRLHGKLRADMGRHFPALLEELGDVDDELLTAFERAQNAK